jgi:DNA-binding transcriptional ArsR family regulator
MRGDPNFGEIPKATSNMPPAKAKVSKSAEKVSHTTAKPDGSEPHAGKGNGKSSRLSKASHVFKSIGDPTRLNILVTLAEGERGVGQLCTILDQPQPAISHHLAVLRHCDLVSARRQGRQNLYCLTEQGQQVIAMIRETGPFNDHRDHPAPSVVPIDADLLADVEGFVDDPEGWFFTPNAEFEGRKPVDLLGTPDEPRLRNRIEAAKLGMFS